METSQQKKHLSITGRRCRIHRNDHVVRSLEEGANLIELRPDTKYNWYDGDDNEPSSNNSASITSSLRVDRYDARTLLDEMALQQACSNREHGMSIGAVSSQHDVSQPVDEEGDEEEAAARNYERYGGLAEYSSCFLKTSSNDKPTDGEEKLACKKSSLGSDDCTDNAQTISNAQDEDQPIQLSEEQLQGLPPNIPLPKTVRINTIIEHTASRIASNNQLEVFLKVKQSTNVDFSFLHESNDLHKYFLFLKEKYAKSKPGKQGPLDSDNSDDGASGNALFGLLGDYASSSSDDDSIIPTKNDNSTTSGKSEDREEDRDGEKIDVQSKTNEQDRKRKADRLERLRIWRLKQHD
ncbi:hypothetical protein ACHAXR_013385 [Thalassiosira sp. AJA248-18]